MALKEHAKYNRQGVYDEAMSTFFRHVDTRFEPEQNLPVGDGRRPIVGLRARVSFYFERIGGWADVTKGILVDLEEGVIGGVEKGPYSELFADSQKITAHSGAGNNWAVGHSFYGPQYKERLLESVRHQAEHCDALQSFFMCHSMGGGTGSGLGTFLLGLLADEYPDVYRFCNVVFPSQDDDVVTSPYNAILALHQLSELADAVLPIENQALFDIIDRIQSAGKLIKKGTAIDDAFGKSQKLQAFDSMNNIAANVMLNMTSSMRFEGSLNVDINEITMNLVPFPKLKYLLSSLTPVYHLANIHMPQRKLDQMFTDAFSRDFQLLKVDPRNSTYLACALMLRGDVELSDVRRNIDKIMKMVKFVPWNRDGWKTGLCALPPMNQPYSLLTLSNNCSVQDLFVRVRDRFMRLYRRKAHVHHYGEYMDLKQFEESLCSLDSVKEAYESMDSSY